MHYVLQLWLRAMSSLAVLTTTEPLMQGETIQRPRAQVVDAEGVTAVEFGELLG